MARCMQQPREVGSAAMEKAGAILEGKVVQRLETPLSRDVQVCEKKGRTATLHVIRARGDQLLDKLHSLENHLVNHACNMLHVFGLPSFENEHYTISAGSCTGLVLQSLLRHWSVNGSVRIASDSSAARRFTSRRGLGGEMKHKESRCLWALLQTKTTAATCSQNFEQE